MGGITIFHLLGATGAKGRQKLTQSVYQSVSQPIGQSVNQLASQSASQLVARPSACTYVRR